MARRVICIELGCVLKVSKGPQAPQGERQGGVRQEKRSFRSYWVPVFKLCLSSRASITPSPLPYAVLARGTEGERDRRVEFSKCPHLNFPWCSRLPTPLLSSENAPGSQKRENFLSSPHLKTFSEDHNHLTSKRFWEIFLPYVKRFLNNNNSSRGYVGKQLWP